MRISPPMHRPMFRTTLVQLSLLGLSLLAMPSLADVYDDVERLIRNGQLERASQLSAEHLRQSPQDPQMRLLSSRILDEQGQPDAAIGLLESLTLEFPELPEPHNNLAVLYARQARVPQALESLHKALLARPDYTLALENLGDLHLSLALQAYQRAGQSATPSATAASKAGKIAPMLQR